MRQKLAEAVPEATPVAPHHTADDAASVHDVLAERERLMEVLAHMDTAADPEYPSIEMIGWLRRRIRQLEQLVSPAFLDISARSGKIAFDEPETVSEEDRFTYYPPVALQFWSIARKTAAIARRQAVNLQSAIPLA